MWKDAWIFFFFADETSKNNLIVLFEYLCFSGKVSFSYKQCNCNIIMAWSFCCKFWIFGALQKSLLCIYNVHRNHVLLMTWLYSHICAGWIHIPSSLLHFKDEPWVHQRTVNRQSQHVHALILNIHNNNNVSQLAPSLFVAQCLVNSSCCCSFHVFIHVPTLQMYRLISWNWAMT